MSSRKQLHRSVPLEKILLLNLPGYSISVGLAMTDLTMTGRNGEVASPSKRNTVSSHFKIAKYTVNPGRTGEYITEVNLMTTKKFESAIAYQIILQTSLTAQYSKLHTPIG